MRLTIESTDVTTKTGTSSRTGKPYSIREQPAWLHTDQRFPVRCTIPLRDDQEPYAPGDYEIERPLTVGRFDALQVSRDLGLRPVKSSAVKAA